MSQAPSTASTASTVPELFLERIRKTPQQIAFNTPEGKGWRDWSWEQIGDRVRDVAMGLRGLGLQDEQRCAIAAGTRLEWVLADLGILCAGGATTTIYPSTTPDDTTYIINDSGSAFVFAENQEQLEKLKSRRRELSGVKKVILFDLPPGGGNGSADDWVIGLAELEALGRKAHEADPAAFERHARAVRKDSLSVLVYTSGTTGRPKGVELVHDCWVYEAEAIEQIDLLRPDDVQYLWLPLSHVFGKVLEVAQIRSGFRTAIDGRVDKLVENLAVVKPTFVCAVPRIFEKVHNRVVSQAKAGGPLKAAIFRWAFRVGMEVSRLTRAGKRVGPALAARHALADRLVFSKLKARFGGKLRMFVSGSAPLSPELAEFFHAAGLLVLEGYGLTESSAFTCVNRDTRFRFGTVGLPAPGTEVKIAESDGEILIRGRGVMRGYHHLPEATSEALDREGWLHTGDIGVIEDGFVRITDRKKDLIKTSGGKYVSPAAIEGKLKAICPFVSQALVHGNNRHYCSALITLDEEAVKAWAQQQGLPPMSYEELSRHERVKKLIAEYVGQLNATLANYETVKKWALLPADFTLEAGELTPSLKVKRKVVEEKHRSLLEGFYSASLEKM
ncbi:MAG TPA: long-chain fatty acid--CoA ligase [Myxococcales bacterium]|nr:long-chain fatty acid--CoA ligase [Myxococcales bacterium]